MNTKNLRLLEKATPQYTFLYSIMCLAIRLAEV